MRAFLTHFESPRTQASRLGPCGNLTFCTETFNSFFAPITLQGFFLVMLIHPGWQGNVIFSPSFIVM